MIDINTLTLRNCWRVLVPLPWQQDWYEKNKKADSDRLYEAFMASEEIRKREEADLGRGGAEVKRRLEDRQAARLVISKIKALTEKRIENLDELNSYDLAKTVHEIHRMVDSYEKIEAYEGGMQH